MLCQSLLRESFNSTVGEHTNVRSGNILFVVPVSYFVFMSKLEVFSRLPRWVDYQTVVKVLINVCGSKQHMILHTVRLWIEEVFAVICQQLDAIH